MIVIFIPTTGQTDTYTRLLLKNFCMKMFYKNSNKYSKNKKKKMSQKRMTNNKSFCTTVLLLDKFFL